MTTDDTSENIQRVLGEFELRSTQVELLSSTNHCNAKIVTDSGNYFLKILAPGYPEVQLQSQMKLADFLRNGGLPIPAPLETMAGHRFATTFIAGEARFGVVSPWIDGETLDVHTEANWIERSGELLACLHARSQFFDPPDDFELRAWDEVYVPREEGWLRSFLANSSLDDEVKEIIERAATRTRTLDSRLPKDRRNYWLVHADFHGENQIFDGEKIWIVDLEDVGWGHLLFDVVWSAVLFAKHHPGSGGSLDPLLRGYERIRPFSAAEIVLLPEFQLAAGISALEMIHTAPITNDDPLAIEWFDFAVKWLQTHLT
jgi:Ser/Thr protein kinase RdoA (MazF antagonist)